MTHRQFDILTIGRSSIDLYSNDIGATFESIQSFNAYVGGSPTNIAIGCARLGLRASLMTGFGQDKVGDFIKSYLKKEKVNYQYSPTLSGARSSAVLLGIEPPDKFPLVYYRDNAADIQITTDHVKAIDFHQISIVEISGTALSKKPSRAAAKSAVKAATDAGCKVLLDLDYRLDQWEDLMSYQRQIEELIPFCTLIIGTKEEFLAASVCTQDNITLTDQQMSNPEITGDLTSAIDQFRKQGAQSLIIKTGRNGAMLSVSNAPLQIINGFPVEVLNILGAGDAFAAGLIYGMCEEWSLTKSIRLANACGAIMVTQHGCANFMPTLDEVLTFIDNNGGW